MKQGDWRKNMFPKDMQTKKGLRKVLKWAYKEHEEWEKFINEIEKKIKTTP